MVLPAENLFVFVQKKTTRTRLILVNKVVLVLYWLEQLLLLFVYPCLFSFDVLKSIF